MAAAGSGAMRPHPSGHEHEPVPPRLQLPYAPRAWAAGEPRLDVPFVPTPVSVLRRMLQLAGLRPQDRLYDLGCGDGRIVIQAALRFGVRGVGIDLDPLRIAQAHAGAARAGVHEQVEFRVGNLFEADLSPATVVTLYLLPELNLRLRAALLGQLRTGSRIVSCAFDMGPEWPPGHSERVDGVPIHCWTVPPRDQRRAAASTTNSAGTR